MVGRRPLRALARRRARRARGLGGRVGNVPAGTAAACRATARTDAARIAELDAQVSHETAAFVSQVQETCGPEGRYIHYGLTSYDVVDTAQGMAMRDALQLIDDQLHVLIGVLKRQALEHRDTICMGRSHGIHAEPTTFGAKLAGYVWEFVRHNARLHAVQHRVAVGTISGPVGTYASVPPDVEEQHARARSSSRPSRRRRRS